DSLAVWLIILCCWIIVLYRSRKKYFHTAGQILEQVDQRYLLGELLPDSYRLEDRLYRDMIRRSNKSVIEQLRRVEQDRRSYKEYIEGWVHEIKAPITGISLVCENGRKTSSFLEKEAFRTLSIENQKIENYVDMVLYYARSEEVYKDYLIRETDLGDVAAQVLEKNCLILIQKHIRAEVNCTHTVFTDQKWIAFILNQMILNSAKYCCDTPVLQIYTEHKCNGVVLTLEDNGTGIRPQDLPRIFEKGFTGAGGRDHERATG
ncbi:MAG: sensor histidine kinase, partial [Acetatifactor sp.]|nr:sensor histidine kinase [Acetatifactor sp.]